MFCQAGRRPSSLDFNNETNFASVDGKPIVSGNAVWKPLPASLLPAYKIKAEVISFVCKIMVVFTQFACQLASLMLWWLECTIYVHKLNI
jgi:hypothetical protein